MNPIKDRFRLNLIKYRKKMYPFIYKKKQQQQRAFVHIDI